MPDALARLESRLTLLLVLLGLQLGLTLVVVARVWGVL